MGVPEEHIERILNHRSAEAGIIGVYQLYKFLPEKRAALEAWGRHVLGLVEPKPDNVVAIGSRG